jgi:hypothetical protein
MPDLADGDALARVFAAIKVLFCDWCADLHFRAYPEQPGSSCNHPECGCWCGKGTGQ